MRAAPVGSAGSIECFAIGMRPIIVRTSGNVRGAGAYGKRIPRSFATDHPARARAIVLIAPGGDTPTSPAVARAIPRIVFGLGAAEQRLAAPQ